MNAWGRYVWLLIAGLLANGWVQATELVVYSSRKEYLVKPLFDAYEQATGVKINYTTDKAGALIARLRAEGPLTQADMLVTVDAGNLWFAAEQGLLSPVASETLQVNVPAHLRDPDNHWFGLTVRARTLVYNTERVKPAELSRYEDLASPEWQGRLCLRTAKKVYNQSLVATMIDRLGAEQTEQVVRGWVDNLAVPVFSNDTRAIQAVIAGQCDVTLVNTYYLGRLLREEPQAPVTIFWPNQAEGQGGVHVNISGAGVTRHAREPAAAQALLEWLSSIEAQKIAANINLEYPVNPAVSASAEVESWGEFKPDSRNVATAGRYQADAVKLMDRAGYR